MSAFAAEKSDAKNKDEKKNVKRGVFGVGSGYGGYGGYGGYSGYYGGHSLGHSYGGHGLGYSAYAAAPVAYSAPHYTSTYVQPHTHTHSVETKVVAQVRIFFDSPKVFDFLSVLF